MKRLAKLLALGALLGFGVPACSDDGDTPPKPDTVLSDSTTSDGAVTPDGAKKEDGTAADGTTADGAAGDVTAVDQAATNPDGAGGN